MAFPDTLTNLKIYLDSKQNNGYTTRDVVDGDRFIELAPALGSGTINATAGRDGLESEQPILDRSGSNDLVLFPGTEGRYLKFAEATEGTGLHLGHTTAPVDFMLGIKFIRNAGFNGSIISNDSADRNFGIERAGNEDQNLTFKVKGKQVLLEDGVTELRSALNAPIDDGEHFVVIRANLENEVGDVIFNGQEFNNVVLNGTGDAGFPNVYAGARRNGFVPLENGQIEYIIGAQSFGTLDQLRDLNLFLRGELDVLSHRVIVDGETQSGVKVAFFQMDAFAANNVASGAFENTLQLGTAVSDANGVATLDVSGIAGYNDTKVHFAQYADALYRVSDSKWLLPQGFSSRNINMSPPT